MQTAKLLKKEAEGGWEDTNVTISPLTRLLGDHESLWEKPLKR